MTKLDTILLNGNNIAVVRPPENAKHRVPCAALTHPPPARSLFPAARLPTHSAARRRRPRISATKRCNKPHTNNASAPNKARRVCLAFALRG